MSAELILLISLTIGIEVAMPIGTYLLFNGRHDDKTRLWLTNICLASTGMILVALRPFLLPLNSFLVHEIPWILVITAFVIMVEVIRRETRPAITWWFYGIGLGVWTLYLTLLAMLGLTESWGIASYSAVMSLLCAVLWCKIQNLQKFFASKSLRLLQIGMALYGLPSFMRVLAYLYTGSTDVMNVFKFGFISSILIFTFIMAVLFVSLGYWGFTLEKSQRESRLAIQGQRRAEQESEEIRKLMQERDRLLVMNSRFSVVSALSSFSAMLIHDISQPLQTLQLGLESTRQRILKGLSRDQIVDDINQLERASDRAGALVTSLRHLMKSGESQVVEVLVTPLFVKIDEILNSESLRKKVALSIEFCVSNDIAVLAEPVMLQRIVLNIVANSLNQFQANTVVNPAVLIRLAQEIHAGKPGVSIAVIDNGGGFAAPVLERLGQPWSSQTQDGLGMALMLSKQLVGLWGGTLELSNRTDGISGAQVKIWLRKKVS